MDIFNNKFKTISSSLEKATQFRNFILLWSFIYALDSFFVLYYKANFLLVSEKITNYEMLPGAFLLFSAVFSFLMAIFFPVIRRIILSFRNAPRDKQDDEQYVYILKRDAYLNKDKFTLDEVNRHEYEMKELESDLNISFSLVCLVLINLFISNEEAKSISFYLLEIIKNKDNMFIFIFGHFLYFVFAITLMIWFYASIKNRIIPDVMYFPKEEKKEETSFN